MSGVSNLVELFDYMRLMNSSQRLQKIYYGDGGSGPLQIDHINLTYNKLSFSITSRYIVLELGIDSRTQTVYWKQPGTIRYIIQRPPLYDVYPTDAEICLMLNIAHIDQLILTLYTMLIAKFTILRPFAIHEI